VRHHDVLALFNPEYYPQTYTASSNAIMINYVAGGKASADTTPRRGPTSCGGPEMRDGISSA
jgi:hypothetical protein